MAFSYILVAEVIGVQSRAKLIAEFKFEEKTAWAQSSTTLSTSLQEPIFSDITQVCERQTRRRNPATPTVQMIWHDPVSVILRHVDPSIPAEGETIHFSHFLCTSLRSPSTFGSPVKIGVQLWSSNNKSKKAESELRSCVITDQYPYNIPAHLTCQYTWMHLYFPKPSAASIIITHGLRGRSKGYRRLLIGQNLNNILSASKNRKSAR
uniref:Uncharacterized protein n=1 Tax=Branchiostoma floridae TaxID=7739 RepID=C3ZNJ7_BRAFL|eukprot:XP_002589838.1 hypothetical protein BRAFLDRAFT_105661 [Branchiostoma floridae]